MRRNRLVHVRYVLILLVGIGMFLLLLGATMFTLVTPVRAQSDLKDYTVQGTMVSVPKTGKFWQAGDGESKLNAAFVSVAQPGDSAALSKFTAQLAQDMFAVWIDASTHNGTYTTARLAQAFRLLMG